jgi:hypothetical protein
MAASLAHYLKDFGEPQPVEPAIIADTFGGGFEEDNSFGAVVEAPIDLEVERAAAYAHGHEEASADLKRQWDEDRETLLAEHAKELEALRIKLEVDAAKKIVWNFDRIANSIAQVVSDQTAGVLAPLIEEALITKAVADLADLLRAAMAEGDVGTLTVRGTTHLFEELKTAFGDKTPVLRHIEAVDIDISVDMGETALVTRMSAWSASLKKVLG